MDPRLVVGESALRGPSGLRVRFGAGTHPGQLRERNEDACGAFVPSEELALPVDAAMVVSDGVGGHQGGAEASRFTVDAVRDTLASLEGVEDPAALLDALLHGIHRELLRQADEQGMRGGMGATITLALLLGNDLFLAQVGDSRGYLLREGKLSQLTRDDSWVAERERVVPGEGGDAPGVFGKNVLTQCLGIGSSLRVQVVPVEALPGDRYLLCSDGLHGPVSDPEIQEVLTRVADPGQVVETLLARANAAGGPDNIAAVVFDVGPPFPAEVRAPRGPGGTLPEGIPTGAGTTLPGGVRTPSPPSDHPGPAQPTGAPRTAPEGDGRPSRRAGSVLVGLGVLLMLGGSAAGFRMSRADGAPGGAPPGVAAMTGDSVAVPEPAAAVTVTGADTPGIPDTLSGPRPAAFPDPVGLPDTMVLPDTLGRPEAGDISRPEGPVDTLGVPDPLASPDSTITPDLRPDRTPGDTTLVSPDSIPDGADTVPTPPFPGLPHQE